MFGLAFWYGFLAGLSCQKIGCLPCCLDPERCTRRAAQVIPPIATHFSVAWSVCRLSHLNHSTDLDVSWQELVGSKDTSCQMGVPDTMGEGEILVVEPSARTCNYLFMIHQGAAPISGSAFYRVTSVLV